MIKYYYKGGEDMDSLALSNDYTTLLKEAERLRADLSSKIIERDNLVLIECKNLSVIYYTTIGIYEYKVFEKYCAIQRIKRKIELIQMYLNRGEAVYIPAVEAQLDKEYAEYAQRLDDFLNDINTADDLSKCGFLSPEETAELKKQYRGIVKRLHPDLNPNITEQQLELFRKAVEAYENGDLEALKTIDFLIDSVDTIDLSESSVDRLKEQIRRCKEQIERLDSEMREVKSSFPYNKKEILEDEARIHDEIEELKKTLDNYREIYAAYEQRLKTVLGDTDG